MLTIPSSSTPKLRGRSSEAELWGTCQCQCSSTVVEAMEIGSGALLCTSSLSFPTRILPLNQRLLAGSIHSASHLRLPSHLQGNSQRLKLHSCIGVRAYIEKGNPVKELLSKVVGSLPVVGLLYRILSDEGGVAGDRVRFAEFCKRVENRCTPEASRAFFDFGERHGKVGKPRFVLIWCWVAAVGAGLIKSEDILAGASRLRVSSDLQYEEENFNILMDEAAQRQAKLRSPFPEIPMEVRVEKAFEAICKCCIGSDVIQQDDARLLSIILQAVFPSADKAEIERTVWNKIQQSSINKEMNQDMDEETKEPCILHQDAQTVYQ